jgi:hypothetical protein
MVATKRKIDDEELQRRKTKAEIAFKEEQTKREYIKRKAEEGGSIPRESFDLELAARAGVLEHGLKFSIQSHAGDWIEAMAGAHERTGDLIQMINDAVDQALNDFSNLREFHVLFKIEIPSAEDTKH